jgi:myosin heavy subunit
METVPQLEDILSDVALLLQQQKYDEALTILGDLLEKKPAHRETRMYRLLIVRIFVLRHSLTHPTIQSTKYPRVIASFVTRVASAMRGFKFHKTPGSSVQCCQTAQMSLDDQHSHPFKLTELNQQVDKLTINNQDLLGEIDSFSKKLATRESTIEEIQTIQQGTQFENQQLHAASQEFQQEVADLKTKLQTSESRLTESISQNQELAERNSKLQTEASELKQQLYASEKTNEELQSEQQHLREVKVKNQQLQEEITNLRNLVQASETRLTESARQNRHTAERYAWLQIEVADLKQEVEESQSKARELEGAQQQLANVESREMIFRDQQHKLEAQIAVLQRELSAGKEKVQELDATRERLAEMEHVSQELREEKRRLEEEISRWQERLSESEENQRQVTTLRQQLDELKAKQALVDSNFQLIDGLPQPQSDANLPHALPSTTNTLELNRRWTESLLSIKEENEPAIWISGTRKWRFGIISATGAIAVASLLAVDFLGKSSDEFSGSKEAAVAETASDEQRTPSEAASTTPQRPTPASVTALGKTEVSKQTPAARSAPRLKGTFKTIRPTELFSGPSEDSALIASIRPGMKINVIDSRGGWLEIRSRHGRPSGFVRQEAAVRIDDNQG